MRIEPGDSASALRASTWFTRMRSSHQRGAISIRPQPIVAATDSQEACASFRRRLRVGSGRATTKTHSRIGAMNPRLTSGVGNIWFLRNELLGHQTLPPKLKETADNGCEVRALKPDEAGGVMTVGGAATAHATHPCRSRRRRNNRALARPGIRMAAQRRVLKSRITSLVCRRLRAPV